MKFRSLGNGVVLKRVAHPLAVEDDTVKGGDLRWDVRQTCKHSMKLDMGDVALDSSEKVVIGYLVSPLCGIVADLQLLQSMVTVWTMRGWQYVDSAWQV